MKKSDLISGKHIVELRDGSRLLVAGDYLPDIDEENAYRECIKRRYSGELLSLFDRALLCNRFSLYFSIIEGNSVYI